jgi:hypothetical protein
MACCTVNAQSIAFQPGNKSSNQAVTAHVIDEKIADNVRKKFNRGYPGITGELWAKSNNGYVVEFGNGKMQKRVFLTENGNTRYQISYYSEAELPADIRMDVKSVYYDYSIFCVQEINLAQKKIYLVFLEDKSTWKIIRIDENNMEVYKEYAKG